MKRCPCGTEISYSTCCGRFITGEQIPAIPVELMRSRYTAYTQANIDYILQTMKSPAADGFDAEDTRSWAQQVKWLKLEVVDTKQINNAKGFVEFRAHYFYQHKKQIMHEISEFHLHDGRWFYVDGISPSLPSVKISRNDPCPCGSGKKYKKCCMAS